MNIIFTGMRGSGKTRLGLLLARRLQWRFVDMDHFIEEKIEMPIAQFVSLHGWEVFRRIEKEVALECSRLDQSVISTGGGTFMDQESALALKKNGVVVFLLCPPNRLKKNLARSHPRPSLKGKSSSLDELEEVWDERKKRYHATADLIHDTSKGSNFLELLDRLKDLEFLKRLL